jgi:hypothetical protein
MFGEERISAAELRGILRKLDRLVATARARAGR